MSPSVVDLTTQVGSVELRTPVMTAAGTVGYGTEIAAFVDLSELGAVVTKSLAHFEWDGNLAPRVYPTAHGMINAVGLQGPGLDHWLTHDLPALTATGATVVCSLWGRSVADFEAAARIVSDAPDNVVAIEVNLSCPNLEGRGGIFAHDPGLSAEVVAATSACGRPRWAKLSPNTDRIAAVAAAVAEAGAEAVTIANTLLGLVFDPATWRPVLGNGGGGVSGRAIHPIAVRAVNDVRRELPELPIVGVGGVTNGWEALEFLLAGAQAIQVGTAHFADPRAGMTVTRELADLLSSGGIRRLDELSAVAYLHGNSTSAHSGAAFSGARQSGRSSRRSGRH